MRVLSFSAHARRTTVRQRWQKKEVKGNRCKGRKIRKRRVLREELCESLYRLPIQFNVIYQLQSNSIGKKNGSITWGDTWPIWNILLSYRCNFWWNSFTKALLYPKLNIEKRLRLDGSCESEAFLKFIILSFKHYGNKCTRLPHQ